MLTARGWWLLAFVAMFLAMGAMLARQGASTVLIVGLAVLLWFSWEWVQFAIQARITSRDLIIERVLRDDRGAATTFWAGRTAGVTLRARLNGKRSLAYVCMTDRVPTGAAPIEGSAVWAGRLAPDRLAEWSYRLHCTLPGAARFEGVRVQITDPQGLFLVETFLRAPVVVPILPMLVDADAKQRTNKRTNLLPPPGMHRHRRPGSGSELLDLRDYRPGDPPKRIAWKASARRDRLITREFESEVPLRCTLFVDASDSVRLGPPGRNAIAGLIGTAAAVAQAAAGNRDLVGLAICDERRADYTAPARTPKHVVALLRKLARAAGLAPATEAADVAPLLDSALVLANEVYPDLMRPNINRFPGWLAWLRPQPGWTLRRPTLIDRVLGSTLGVIAFALFTVALMAVGAGFVWMSLVMSAPAFAFTGVAVVVATILLATQLTGRRRRTLAARKRLGALIGQHYELPLGAAALILEDDAACAAWLQRFLADHQIPYEVPLYDDRGRYLFARPAKVAVMAQAVTRAVSRGHDNELFVVLADLLELGGDLRPLLEAVRVARARHHQVLIICPTRDRPSRRNDAAPSLPVNPSEADLLTHAETLRGRRAWNAVRRSFARYGVPVLRASGAESARAILQRLDQMRALQGARRA